MAVKIQTQSFVRGLWAVMAVMVVLGLFRDVMRSFFGLDHMGGLGPLIELDEESNIPTLFSVVILLLASVTSYLGCKLLPPETVSRKWGWYLLSVGFVAMAIDEFVGIHEHIGAVAHELLGNVAFHGLFRFVWPIPALGLLLVLAFVFIPFLRYLPPAFRLRLCVSGAIYMGGAVGMEMVGGYYYEYIAAGDRANFGYSMLTVIEETMEMSGIVLYISTMLREVRRSGTATLELE